MHKKQQPTQTKSTNIEI